jgi:hypothetical protein
MNRLMIPISVLVANASGLILFLILPRIISPSSFIEFSICCGAPLEP